MPVYSNINILKTSLNVMALFEGNNILSIIEMITMELQKSKISTEITYRLKHPKSVLEKMIMKNLDLHEIRDLIAFRFIVQELKDCYTLLDIIKQVCVNNVMDKKDYIVNPKENGYRSLHVVISDNKFMRNVEMQIRTKKMHNVAELGSASHSIYKDKRKVDYILYAVFDNITTKKVHEIWYTFQWTIPELDTYEEELKEIWHRYKATKVNV